MHALSHADPPTRPFRTTQPGTCNRASCSPCRAKLPDQPSDSFPVCFLHFFRRSSFRSCRKGHFGSFFSLLFTPRSSSRSRTVDCRISPPRRRRIHCRTSLSRKASYSLLFIYIGFFRAVEPVFPLALSIRPTTTTSSHLAADGRIHHTAPVRTLCRLPTVTS